MNSICPNSTLFNINKISQISFMHGVIGEKVKFIRKVKELLVAYEYLMLFSFYCSN